MVIEENGTYIQTFMICPPSKLTAKTLTDIVDKCTISD